MDGLIDKLKFNKKKIKSQKHFGENLVCILHDGNYDGN